MRDSMLDEHDFIHIATSQIRQGASSDIVNQYILLSIAESLGKIAAQQDSNIDVPSLITMLRSYDQIGGPFRAKDFAHNFLYHYNVKVKS